MLLTVSLQDVFSTFIRVLDGEERLETDEDNEILSAFIFKLSNV